MIRSKYKIFLLTYIVLASRFLYSQELHLIGPPGGEVRFSQLGIQKNFTENVYAAGYYGSLFRSPDGGNSVFQIETNFKDYIVSTISPHPTNDSMLYIGAHYISLKTINAGQSWEILNQSNYSRSHFVFNGLDDDVIYMNRNTKEIWRSDDGGDSWYFMYSFNDEITSLAISPIDTSVLYCGADNFLYKSSSSGWNWTQVPNIMGDIWKIKVNPFNTASVYMKVGGILMKSMNDGAIAQNLLAGDVADFEVSNSDTNIIYASQYSLLKTTNEGNSWFSIVNEGLPNVNINSEAILLNPQDDNELYAGINALGVYKTKNGGDSWFRTNLSNSDVYTIYVDPDTAGHTITGQYGWGAMYTFDDGVIWNNSELGSEFQNLRIQYFSFNPENRNEGLAAAYYGIYQTTDRGRSWYQINAMEPVITVSYHPYISNVVFATLEYGLLIKSVDGGINWYQVLSGKTIHEYAYHPVNQDVIHTISSVDVLKSSDKGESWQTINNGIDNSLAPFTSIAISATNPEILYCGRRAVGQTKGSLYMTTNGGELWFSIDSTLHNLDNWVSVSSIWIDPNLPMRVYVGLFNHGDPLIPALFSNGQLLLTEDDGKHWRKVYDSHVNVIKADNSNPRNIYVGTKFGVMKFLDTLTVTGAFEPINEILREYFLFQNYPNPFNPSTKISWQSPLGGYQTIKVFDVLGNEIATLVDEYKPAGKYEVEFNSHSGYVRNLPSGVYFYQLKAVDPYTGSGQGFVQTRKMVILK
jgi:photosystem II stability/assembly factor-like uncharacterized protein